MKKMSGNGTNNRENPSGNRNNNRESGKNGISNENEHNNSDNHVRIDKNSESDLQALFDLVLKPDSNRMRPVGVPWHLRNLPDSFFTPPSTGSKSPSVQSISHSRENSADSAFGTTTTPAGLQVRRSSPFSLSSFFGIDYC